MPDLTRAEQAELDRRRAAARAKARRLIETADPAADAAVVAAAKADPDARPMTGAALARMRPAHEVHPELAAASLRRRGRPRSPAPKQQVTLRLDADVIARLRASGAGWQARVNELLRRWLAGESGGTAPSKGYCVAPQAQGWSRTMMVQLYRNATPGRSALHAVFRKESNWGDERAGHDASSWTLLEEVNLDKPDESLSFSAIEARRTIEADGVFYFEKQSKPTPLELEEDRLLSEFRLKVTIPLLRDTGVDCPEILGTGTLVTHEDRYFIVTADHIFREDVDDASSPLIPMADVAVPERPVRAELRTLGSHHIYRLTPPVLADVIVLEVVEPATIKMLKSGWGFLTAGQVDLPRSDDRFVISGFMIDSASFTNNIVHQAMLNLETDFLHDTPAVKEPAPGYDLFFYLANEGAMIDGSRRPITTLQGLSGGPIWALRRPAAGIWAASKMLKLVAVQSSEMKRKWSRGVHWNAVLAILRQPELAFTSPP
jgi:uncharacterized protein (DUF4415 family)